MSAIKVGDLVYVARDCCGAYVGTTFRVASVETYEAVYCRYCGKAFFKVTCAETGLPGGKPMGRSPLSWLKRIDPLPESERTPTEEELTA